MVSRLHGTGPFASLAFESPMTTFSFRASAQELSDDNDRQRATLTWTRALSSRLNHVRLIGWAESLRYRTSSPEYSSPSRQIRADAGLQDTHEFSKPRFQNDRQQTLSFGYLVGLDDDGETYHHPMVNLALRVCARTLHRRTCELDSLRCLSGDQHLRGDDAQAACAHPVIHRRRDSPWDRLFRVASLLETVTTEIGDAMRKKDQASLAPLRMLKAAIMNKEVEKGRSLTRPSRCRW